MELIIQGHSLELLGSLSADVASRLNEVPGVLQIENTLGVRAAEANLHYEEAGLHDLGINIRDLVDIM